MKLYEIPIRYQEWLAKVEENDGELDGELEIELDEIEDDFATKADAYSAMIRSFKYEEEAYREEVRRMSAKADAAAHKQERLKHHLLWNMKAMKIDRVKGKMFSISRVVNKTPAISWDSNQPIPERFRRVRVSLDGKAAHEALESEGSLPEGFKVTNTEYVRIT